MKINVSVTKSLISMFQLSQLFNLRRDNFMTGQLSILRAFGLCASLLVLNGASTLLSIAATLILTAPLVRADIFYVSTELHHIDKITSDGTVSVFASLLPPSVYPAGVAFDVSGNLYATDPNKDQILMITPSGAMSIFATLPSGSFPYGLAFDGSGNLFVSNNFKDEISKITSVGTISHFATLPTESHPAGLAFDTNGNLYVSDNTDQIRRITSSGSTSLFATLPAGSVPLGLAFDAIGNLYVADDYTDQISKITAGGAVSLFATLPTESSPIGLAFDSSGNLYVADLTGQVNKITTTGAVSLFASVANESLLYIAVTDDAGHALPLPPPTLIGDYNRNGTVDAADYVVWRKGLGSVYNQLDYQVWRAHFGETRGVGSGDAGGQPSQAAVPEPTTLVLLLFAAAGQCLRRSRST